MAEIGVSGIGASFPVVFFDGDREVELGPVAVYPSLGFRKLQTTIGEKIGVSPHQISVSLVRRKKARSSPEVRRKVPIHESSDFSALAKERDCFLLAVLRRSRSERRVQGRRGGARSARENSGAEAALPQKLTILKRNRAVDSVTSTVGLWDYEAHIRELEWQRERYLMSTTAAPYLPYIADVAGLQNGYVRNLASPPASPDPPSVCELCAGTKSVPGEDGGGAAAFHRCVRA